MDPTVSLVPASKDSLQVEAQTWAARAASFSITDAASCIDASHFLRSIKGVRGDIQRWFEPHVEAAMETKRKAESARKALTDERDRMEAPLVQAEAHVKKALIAWETEQETRRQAEEAALQAEARKRAEEATLAAAASLESEANATGNAEMLQEAHDILSQPIDTPDVVVRSSMPKVQGVTYRDNWRAFTTDLRLLAGAVADGSVAANLVTPNLTALNQMAKATQGTQKVPGVKFFNERNIAARG